MALAALVLMSSEALGGADAHEQASPCAVHSAPILATSPDLVAGVFILGPTRCRSGVAPRAATAVFDPSAATHRSYPAAALPVTGYEVL